MKKMLRELLSELSYCKEFSKTKRKFAQFPLDSLFSLENSIQSFTWGVCMNRKIIINRAFISESRPLFTPQSRKHFSFVLCGAENMTQNTIFQALKVGLITHLRHTPYINTVQVSKRLCSKCLVKWVTARAFQKQSVNSPDYRLIASSILKRAYSNLLLRVRPRTHFIKWDNDSYSAYAKKWANGRWKSWPGHPLVSQFF